MAFPAKSPAAYNGSMKTATHPPATEAAIWKRVIHPNGKLSRPVARAMLELEFEEQDRSRMHELALKAQEGKLTPAEEFDIENFERVGTLLAILKSEARQLLKRSTPRQR